MQYGLVRAGAVSGLVIGVTYILITVAYVLAGQLPSRPDGVEWLSYLSERQPIWWAIIALSVVTDLLYVPVAAALAVASRPTVNVLAGAALLVLFVVLDLAVTWTNFGALMRLADADASGAVAAAATYAASVLDSSLFAVYAILIPSVGILLLSMALLRELSRAAGWIGVATGMLGSIAVLGGLVVESIGTLAIPASVLTAAWFVVVGYRLLRLPA